MNTVVLLTALGNLIQNILFLFGLIIWLVFFLTEVLHILNHRSIQEFLEREKLEDEARKHERGVQRNENEQPPTDG